MMDTSRGKAGGEAKGSSRIGVHLTGGVGSDSLHPQAPPMCPHFQERARQIRADSVRIGSRVTLGVGFNCGRVLGRDEAWSL